MKTAVVTDMTLPGLDFVKRGKVREIFRLDSKHFLFIASDRISAFDVVLNQGIPGKGRVLNQMSTFWLRHFADLAKNHLVTSEIGEMPQAVQDHADVLSERCMVVKATQPYPVECIVRGYLAGSGWKDYQKTGKVCGIDLPTGLQNSSRLDEPIFTPSTKAETGHDENIPYSTMVDLVGSEVAAELRDKSLEIYNRARLYAEQRGFIIADTKFEWGELDGEPVLIDEVLTPDSSRFWPGDLYRPGQSQPSLDKQIIRDWLEARDWDKTPPAPDLPEEVIAKTAQAYEDVFVKLSRS